MQLRMFLGEYLAELQMHRCHGLIDAQRKNSKGFKWIIHVTSFTLVSVFAIIFICLARTQHSFVAESDTQPSLTECHNIWLATLSALAKEHSGQQVLVADMSRYRSNIHSIEHPRYLYGISDKHLLNRLARGNSTSCPIVHDDRFLKYQFVNESVFEEIFWESIKQNRSETERVIFGLSKPALSTDGLVAAVYYSQLVSNGDGGSGVLLLTRTNLESEDWKKIRQIVLSVY